MPQNQIYFYHGMILKIEALFEAAMYGNLYQ